MTPDHELMASTDPALAALAQEGDEVAFGQLFDRHAEAVWGYALALTGDPDESAAVVVETFARVFTRLRTGRVDAGTTFRRLALTVARDTTLDRARDRRVPEAPFAHADDFEARQVARAFTALPERWRSVLWLSEIERMRAPRVAPIVGLAPEATSDLARRARNGFRERYVRADLDSTDDRACVRAAGRLVAHLDGTLTRADDRRLTGHLTDCDACTTRRRELAELGPRLGLLLAPMPDLAESASRSWSGVVTTARTSTGLSPRAEKLVAGFGATAAAIGVIGATMLGVTTARDGARPATSPVTPGLSETAAQQPPRLDEPVLLDLPRGTSGDRFGDGVRRGIITPPAATAGDVVGASGPGAAPTPVDLAPLEPLEPRQPRDSMPAAEPKSDDDSPASTAPAPVIAAGIDVGPVPVAVEIGTDPGLTAGPVSVGSEPEVPDQPVEVGPPLAPAATAVDAAAPLAPPPAGL